MYWPLKKGYRVNCTYPIPLKRADENEDTKWMAKEALTIAEKYNLIEAEQYSKLSGSAIRLSSNRQMMYNISRRKPVVASSNDTRSCYDRIIHVAKSLTLHRLGILKLIIVNMLHTIQKMEHSIQMSFGNWYLWGWHMEATDKWHYSREWRNSNYLGSG